MLKTFFFTLKIKFAGIFIIIFVINVSKYVGIVSFKLIGNKYNLVMWSDLSIGLKAKFSISFREVTKLLIGNDSFRSYNWGGFGDEVKAQLIKVNQTSVIRSETKLRKIVGWLGILVQVFSYITSTCGFGWRRPWTRGTSGTVQSTPVNGTAHIPVQRWRIAFTFSQAQILHGF